jgi:hypothetical protein
MRENHRFFKRWYRNSKIRSLQRQRFQARKYLGSGIRVMQGLSAGIQKRELNIPGDEDMAEQEKLIIIGGSAGGPSAAARAKRVDPNLEVTMFEQGRFVSYGS